MGSSLNSTCDTNHGVPITCNAIWVVPSLAHCLGQIYFKAFLGLEAVCVWGDVVWVGLMGRLLGFCSVCLWGSSVWGLMGRVLGFHSLA